MRVSRLAIPGRGHALTLPDRARTPVREPVLHLLDVARLPVQAVPIVARPVAAGPRR